MPAMEFCTRFDLLRHGACQDGAIYRGRTDSQLSDVGWQQLLYATREGGWDRILCSPLLRCRLFADALAERFGLPIDVVDELQELDFGRWDGRLVVDVWREQPAEVTAFWLDPVGAPPPAGESMDQLQQRAWKVLQQRIEAHTGEHLLLLTHSGVIRALLAKVLAIPLANSQQLAIDYASFSRIEFYSSEGVLTGSEVRFINRVDEGDDGP